MMKEINLSYYFIVSAANIASSINKKDFKLNI